MNPTDSGYQEWLLKMMGLPAVKSPPRNFEQEFQDLYQHRPLDSMFRFDREPRTARMSDHSTSLHMSVPRQNGKATIAQMLEDAFPSKHTHIHTSIYDNKESTMNRTEVIAAELARLQDELAQRNVYGEDDYDEGAVLRFKVVYDASSDKSYTYAAIKAGGKWHLTGSQSNSNLTWSQLVDFFIRTNATKVWRMAKTERIV